MLMNVYLAEKLAQEREAEVRRYAEQRRLVRMASEGSARRRERFGRAARRVARRALTLRPA